MQFFTFCESYTYAISIINIKLNAELNNFTLQQTFFDMEFLLHLSIYSIHKIFSKEMSKHTKQFMMTLLGLKT